MTMSSSSSNNNNTLPEESLNFSRSELLRSEAMRSASMRHDGFTVSERADWLLNEAFKSSTITMEGTMSSKSMPIREDDTASETSSTEQPSTMDKPDEEQAESFMEEQELTADEDDEETDDEETNEDGMLSPTRGIISRPSMRHEKFTVGGRAKWLQSEAFQSSSDMPVKTTKKSRHSAPPSTEQRDNKSTPRNKTRSNAPASPKNKAEELISKFGGKAQKKTAVLRRKEEFERQENESKRNADPRSFSKTTWSSKSRCSSGRYTKMVTDTRGVAPRKSLQELP